MTKNRPFSRYHTPPMVAAMTVSHASRSVEEGSNLKELERACGSKDIAKKRKALVLVIQQQQQQTISEVLSDQGLQGTKDELNAHQNRNRSSLQRSLKGEIERRRHRLALSVWLLATVLRSSNHPCIIQSFHPSSSTGR